jgi:hypothetical protein
MFVPLRLNKQLNTNNIILSLMDTNTVEICCAADEFSRQFDGVMEGRLLRADSGKRHRNRRFIMSDAGIMTIRIIFHLKQFRNLKTFYTQYIQLHCRQDFPQTVSY